jgi:3'-5' exoribonuclease
MEARYVTEFAEGSRVDSTLALRAKELRTARSGEPYLVMELSDKTGSISAVYFRPSSAALDVPVGAVVAVQGSVTSFRGSRRITVTAMRPADEWQAGDLMSQGPRSAEELAGEFTRLASSVKHQGLKALLREVFRDKEFFTRFSACPGSQSYHHAYLGGLIEHTVAVADHCAHVAGRYDGVDRDLLVSAALLHDVGKVDELVFETGIGYTDEGRLIGHVVLGARRVHEAARMAGTDPALLVRLEHAMLSHHGELEWGSPKRPSTMEALLLHHVDNLDAKAAGFASALVGATLAEEVWTDAANLFRRPLFAPRPAEDDRPHRVDEDAQHFRLIA